MKKFCYRISGVFLYCFLTIQAFGEEQQDSPASSQQIISDSSSDVFFLNFPSVFSYHVVEEVTHFHIGQFLEKAQEQKLRVHFLNATEYRNIVHALAIETGRFLYEARDLISVSKGFRPIWSNVLNSVLSYWRTLPYDQQQDLYFYIKGIEGQMDEGQGTLQNISLTIGVRTLDGQAIHLELTDPEQNPHLSLNDILRYFPSILHHLRQNLFDSFQKRLKREGLFQQDYHYTLYLKSLSLDHKVVDRLEDIEQINIGIIVEDLEGSFVADLDWIITENQLQLENIDVTIESLSSLAMHEVAHGLVSNVLDNDSFDPQFLTIRPGLSLRREFDNGREKFNVLSDNYTGHFRREREDILFTTKREYIMRMAEGLAGDILDRMVDKNGHGSESPTLYELIANFYSYDAEQSFILAYQGVCLILSYEREDRPCLNNRNMRAWIEWMQGLSRPEFAAFFKEVELWMLEAGLLARQILLYHSDHVVRMTQWILQRRFVNHFDFQSFFGEHPLNPLTISEYQNASMDIDHFRGLFHPDQSSDLLSRSPILNAYLALSFSLDVPQNFERVERTPLEDIFEEWKDVKIPDSFLPFIRENARIAEGRGIGTLYHQGLPDIYMEYLVRKLESFL